METISRISSMLETARELTLEAAQSASSVRSLRPSSYAPRTASISQIKKLLDSRNDRDILDGLRKVISLMYRAEPCLPFFSAVVKNVANPNIEVKKLVYIYLLHHAESEPDLALLSINAIQKSLTDQNPQVRALALRTMSGIKVPVISQIVSLAIKRGCGDMSPHVRKAAALAIPKCYRLDPGTLPQLIEYLSVLLGDNQYFVVGPAVAAFLEICPDQIDLIHKHYRSLVKKLVDMDEWGQLVTLRLMVFYARKCFPQRIQKVKKTNPKGFYDEDNGEDDDDNNLSEEEVEIIDPDLDLLLKACKPLLQSRNSAVIVAVVRCFRYLGTIEHLESATGPLIALLRSPQDLQHVALYNIISVALVSPKPFVKYASHFLVRSTDISHIWRLKLEILTILFPHCGMHFKGVILSELEHFSNGSDHDLVRESVRAIGRCAEAHSSSSTRCLQLLLRQISSADDVLVSEAVTVIRHLIQQDTASHRNTVVMLGNHLGTTSSPGARASIIWLVGEFAGIDANNNIAPDVLRLLAKGFADESETAKQQILLLGAKVYLHHLLNAPEASSEPKDNTSDHYQGDNDNDNNGFDTNGHVAAPTEEDAITTLWRYILLLARYDTSYDLRDRARLYKSLLAVPSSTQLASLLLLAPKPIPHTSTPSETRKNLLIGSSTLVIGPEAGMYGLKGYEDLPDWVKPGQEPDPKLRDDESGKPSAGFGEKINATAGERLDKALQEHNVASGKGTVNGRIGNVPKNMSLDDWLAEEEEEDEYEEDEEGETEEEEETDEDDEEEEEEDEEGESEYETDESGEEEEEPNHQYTQSTAESAKLLK
ncbi:beta adaptin [Arthroderma uncinatum]|uniref:beta adaptin n=1 Tax=Arthroderma uncinatum TaxID=74035 RepID=UPI00144A5F7F|nr:beta adaptin [Arthroderma uncinatum]KAF3483124.1 beta adaptin [Arthroderma uncinatum]